MSTLNVDKVDPSTGTALELGTSGDTINIPSGVTLDINSGATLDATGATVTGAIGKVLQVINATTTTETASSSTTYADTNLTAAITPASTSNTVLVLVHQTGLLKNSSDNAGKIQLLRDATAIGMFENDFGRDGGTGLNIVGGSGYCKLDSPSSVSELTYKTQFACSVTAASSVGVQHNSCVSSMTLMEIGA